MTTKGFDAAMVCLNDAWRHAMEGKEHELTVSIAQLLGKYAVPIKCLTCGQTIPAQTQQWHTQPCDAGAGEGKT